MGSDEDRVRSRRLGAEARGWSSTGQVLSGRTIEGLGDTLCSLHLVLGDVEHKFLSLASKPSSMVSPDLASKPMVTTLVVWPQNHSREFSGLGLKTSSCGLVIWSTKSP
jgi:hypothetical protein